MTVIAFRNGIAAADTGTTRGSSRIGTMIKIVRNEAGDIAGASGDASFCNAFLAWFITGEDAVAKVLPPKEAGTGAIYRAGSERTITMFDESGPYKMEGRYFAIGSGTPEALGAMFAGADAETAVKAAITHDTGCFGDVTVLHGRPSVYA